VLASLHSDCALYRTARFDRLVVAQLLFNSFIFVPQLYHRVAPRPRGRDALAEVGAQRFIRYALLRTCRVCRCLAIAMARPLVAPQPINFIGFVVLIAALYWFVNR
jgi:hypothetical protein